MVYLPSFAPTQHAHRFRGAAWNVVLSEVSEAPGIMTSLKVSGTAEGGDYRHDASSEINGLTIVTDRDIDRATSRGPHRILGDRSLLKYGM